jgi:hypothetical protein
MQHYTEMKQLNLVPDLNTMNSLIKSIQLAPIAEYDKKVEQMMERLNEMRTYGIKPNLHTFNNCLSLLKSFGMNVKVVPIALNVFKEMELVNVKPSLATYAHLLGAIYPNRDVGQKTQILEQILTRVENELNDLNAGGAELEWKDINDGTFFRVAMEKCYAASKKIDNTKRLHSILLRNNNIKFLNDAFSYNRYL